MGEWKGPKQGVGKKGKSGRKTIYEEHNKANAINKLWEKINNKIEAGEKLSEYEQKFAMVALPKTIKTQTDITSGDKPIKFGEINDIHKNNSIPEDSETTEED